MSVTYDGGSLGQAPTLSGLENPTKYSTYINNCFAQLSGGVGGFTLTELNDSGSEFAATAAVVDGKGGVVTISPNTGGDSAHDGVQVGMGNVFKLDKAFYFEAKVKFANVGSVFVGLCPGADDTAYYNGSSAAQPADRIGWENASAGSTSLTFIARKNSTDSTQTSFATANATFVRLGFLWRDGVCRLFLDGAEQGTIETNVPDDVEMGPIIAMTSDGSAGVPSVSVDWIYAIQEA